MTTYIAFTYTEDVDWIEPRARGGDGRLPPVRRRERASIQRGDVLYPTSTATRSAWSAPAAATS